MADNTLTKVAQPLSSSLTDDEIRERIAAALNGVDRIYSYLIYSNYKDNKLVGWSVEYMFSQTDKFNTLKCADIIDEIVDKISSMRGTVKSIVGYRQPSIELLLTIYRPLIANLAAEQSHKWSWLEYEDAYQMCQLVMLKLYRKGYYIHKTLLKRAFENEVLMYLRHEKNRPEIYSLEGMIYMDSSMEDDKLTIFDTISDSNEENESERKENEELSEEIFQKVKDILVDWFGERQFEQLLSDYGNRHTTTWSRKRMQQIKEKFNKLGITKRWFIQ